MKQPSSGRTRRRSRLIIGASARPPPPSPWPRAQQRRLQQRQPAAPAAQPEAARAASSKYPWCGPKQASIALADGFGDNTWRELTRYSAVTIAAQCPSVTKYVYANGEGNTQKAISDINSLVAQGITGIVDFPDAGKAMLPVLTKAYQAGTIVVPYRVDPRRHGRAELQRLPVDRLHLGRRAVGPGRGQGAERPGERGLPRRAARQLAEPGGVPGPAERLQELPGHPHHRPEALQRDQLGPGADPAGRWRRCCPSTRRSTRWSATSAPRWPRRSRSSQRRAGRSRSSPPRTATRSAATTPRCTPRPGVQAVHGVLADLDGGVRHAVRHRPGHQGHGALVHRGPAAELRELGQRQPEPAGLQQDRCRPPPSCPAA